MFLLTAKPIIYIANISEDQILNAEEDEKVMFTKQEMILDGCKFARRSTKKENL